MIDSGKRNRNSSTEIAGLRKPTAGETGKLLSLVFAKDVSILRSIMKRLPHAISALYKTCDGKHLQICEPKIKNKVTKTKSEDTNQTES